MADKKLQIVERTYNVPLRKEWLKTPKYKRSKKAVKALREFLVKHMKSDNVKLGMHLNEHIWQDGIRNPPHHVKINVTKDEDGLVRAELEGYSFKEAVKAKKKEEKATGLKGKLQDALGKKEEAPTEEEAEVKPAAEKKEKPKAKTEKTPIEKKEAKPAVKKETPKKEDK